jgi:hypothetical protein
LGFACYDVNNSIFFKTSGNDLIIILIHVDDYTITAMTVKLVEWVKKGVAEQVEIMDLGEIHWLLGIEVKRDRTQGMISLSQCLYIDTSLHVFGLEDTKPLSIPMDPSTHLTSDLSPKSTVDVAHMAKVPHLEAVGKLMYGALGTHPDITYTIQVLSRFMKNPREAHWEAVKHVFCYLKGMCNLWLTYGAASEKLEGFTDADGNMAEY